MSNVPGAIFAWRTARPHVSTLFPGRHGTLLRLLITMSSSFSFAYHLVERAVRERGLPGVSSVPFWVEFYLLQLDRIFAVALASFVFTRFESISALKSAVWQQINLLMAGTVAGVLSETPSPPWVYALLHSTWHLCAFFCVANTAAIPKDSIIESRSG